MPDPVDGARVVVSLFAPDLGPDHRPVMEAFAALLGAMVGGVQAETRVREASARAEQRLRARTGELSALYDLSLATFRAANPRASLRGAVTVATRVFACDVAAAIICDDGIHYPVVAGRVGTPTPESLDAIDRRLHAGMEILAAGAHATCTRAAAEVVPPALAPARPMATGGLALASDLATILEAPVVCGGRPVGVLMVADARMREYDGEHQRLLYLIAAQLAAVVERADSARTADRGRLSALFESFKDGVLLLHGSGRVLAANDTGQELLAALNQPDGGAKVRALVTAALGGAGRAAGALATQDGPPRHITAIARRVTDIDGAPAALLTLHDMTEAEIMRERLFQSEKMASVGQLVSGVAHELNNPLTGIMVLAQLLQMSELNPEVLRQVELIFGEAERASKIVQNLLSVARRRLPEKVALDLNVLVERVLELWEYGLRTKDIEVRREMTRHLPPCLADPHQIQQVLLNLLGNAAQAIAAGGEHGVITIRTGVSGSYVRLMVSDNGPGIAPEHLRRVFDPFFTTKAPGEGTGLGLTISFGIIEEHNGRITVDGLPGGGATFTVELPRAAITPAGALTPSLTNAAADACGAILVVDDEQTIRESLAQLLARDGHRVDHAGSAAAALAHLDRGRYDAVITDIRMPGMDGIALYRQIIARNPALARRVIFISGDTVNRDTIAFAESAGVPFLPKPFTQADLRELLVEVLRKT